MNAAILLRQKVLDLAIRGKLTKREKGDEPASALLARIVAEKEKRNAKVGRARTSAVPQPIPDDEKPFELPNGWVWARLGELGIWKAGGTPSRSHSEYYRNGDIPWLKTGDLNDGFISDIPEKITKRGLESTSARVNAPGSVLMAMYGATIGKLGILAIPAATNQACCACDLLNCAEPEYLFYYLMAQRHAFIQLGGGGAQANISKEIIVNYQVPVPPVEEQRRIVARIKELLAAIDTYSAAKGKISNAADMLEKKVLDLAIRGKLTKREKGDGSAAKIIDEIAADKAKRIAKKLMRKEKPLPPIMPEDKPFELPKEWFWCRFGELCAYGQCEAVSFSGLPKNTWVLDLEEIEKDTGRLIERKLVKDKQATSGKHLFKKGMLLYSKLRTYLNKVLIADQDGVCTSEIIPIDFHGFVDAAYARIVLMSPYFLSYTASKDYGVKMPRVSTDDMRMAAFPLPPLAEQKRIVERVDAILAECRKISQ